MIDNPSFYRTYICELEQEVERLRTELEAIQTVAATYKMGRENAMRVLEEKSWKSIESAPLGKWVIIWNKAGAFHAMRPRDSAWWCDANNRTLDQPTHWMPVNPPRRLTDYL